MRADPADSAQLELLAVELQLRDAVSIANRAAARAPDPRDAAVDELVEAVRSMLQAPRAESSGSERSRPNTRT